MRRWRSIKHALVSGVVRLFLLSAAVMIAFPDAVEAFYDPDDKSYRSLLNNIPVRTSYEEKQDAIRAGGYDKQ